MRIATACLGAGFLLAGALACDEDVTLPESVEVYVADLSGAHERPTPVQTNATGRATFTVIVNPGANVISWKLEVADLDNATAAHIHAGGPEEAGGVMIGLSPDVPTSPPTGFTGVLAADADDEVADSVIVRMRNGTAYVNVHTQANPAGEIRGQIRRVQ